MGTGNRKATGTLAQRTRRLTFGPGEQNRAADQAAWTRNHGNRPDNPHLREKVYDAATFERVRRFDHWKKAHPEADDMENPHRHPAYQRIDPNDQVARRR